MSFADLRIQTDIRSIALPLASQRLDGRTFAFSLALDTLIYRGEYAFRIEFPAGYPFESPRLFCATPVFHPNVDEGGAVCLKVLREGWMPSYDINSIVASLLWVFEEPSHEDALNVEAGRLLELDYGAFIKRACRYRKGG